MTNEYKHGNHQPPRLHENPTLEDIAKHLVEDNRVCAKVWLSTMSEQDAPPEWLTMINLEKHINNLGYQLGMILDSMAD